MKSAALAVWLFYGLGGHLTSPGIDQIAAQLRAHGAVVHGPYFYDKWASTVPSIKSTAGPKVIIGYSCGVQATAEAAAAAGVKVTVVGIQGSLYCPPPALTRNVAAAVEVWNPSCMGTFGLGCARYTGIANIKLYPRYLSHGGADNDPWTQRVVLRAALGAQ